MDKRGLVAIPLLVIIAIAVGVVGYLIAQQQTKTPTNTDTSKDVSPSPRTTYNQPFNCERASEEEIRHCQLAEVENALKESNLVRVMVIFKGEAVISGRNDTEKQKELIKQNREQILSTLTEEDFRLASAYSTIPAFSGEISTSGLAKLQKNDTVTRVRLSQPLYPN